VRDGLALVLSAGILLPYVAVTLFGWLPLPPFKLKLTVLVIA